MATYYVRTDGSNSNAGTGPAANQAWQTVTYALANMVLTNGTNYLYIAPGVYRETPTVTITPSSTQTLVIQGDPSASQFTGLSSGVVRITSFTTDTANPSAVNILTISGKSYITISRIHFDVFGQTGTRTHAIYGLTNPDNIVVEYCTFQGHNTGIYFSVGFYANNSGAVQSITTNRCIFNNLYIGSWFESSSGAGSSQNVTVTDSLYVGCDLSSVYFYGNGINRKVYNCTIVNFIQHGIRSDTGQSGGTTVQNCLIGGSNGSGVSTTGVGITENYNRFVSCIARTNVSPSGANSTSGGIFGMDIGYGLLNSIINQQMFSTLLNSPNLNFGSSTGAPATDLYGVTWTGTSPDAGSATYRSLSAVGSYVPSERNVSTITIAPGSTSQSIELYLGATGLTASTAGLSARYNRTRTASVNIPLVARTIGQAWISGGFAEVDAVNMPGIYRVDIPDAALAAGADDVTLVVRGASGTNGAVMTVKLSSGGLTSAQTASAVWGAAVAGYGTATDFGGVVNETRNVVGSTETLVQGLPQTIWDEPYTTHTAANTFGARVLKTTADNRLVDVGTSQHIHANVHAIVDSTVAAAELSGALLHNGTDYISADLLSPTSPATLLRMGPYSVVADQTKQEINVDILTGSSLPVVLQLVDANGTGIPLVGATLSVKIYNASGTLVTTYMGTASYSDAGFLTFTLDSVVTATPGTYYLTVTRTTGATDTSIYGGLRLYVRSN